MAKAKIGRGTTPTNIFLVPIDLRDVAVIYITYNQGSKTLIEKTKEDIEIEEDKLSVWLTQEETLMFSQKQGTAQIEMQIRARYPDGNAVESEIMTASVGRILKEGVI